MDPWIWLPIKEYPKTQHTKFDFFGEDVYENSCDVAEFQKSFLLHNSDDSYAVAEFRKTYSFNKKIVSVSIRFSGDTEVQLFCNGDMIATGPSAVGGDFLSNGKSREWYYANQTEYVTTRKSLDFFARVKLCPTRICEYSKGHGGFMLCADIRFEDGSTERVSTDNTWLSRKNGAYVSTLVYDGSILPDKYVYIHLES